MESTNLKLKYLKYHEEGLSEAEIIKRIKDKINIIINFGQTPHKLFDSNHPKRESVRRTKFFEDSSSGFERDRDQQFIKKAEKEKIDVIGSFKKGVKYFYQNPYSICILNGNKEIEIQQIQNVTDFNYLKDLKKKKSLKIRLKPSEKLSVAKCTIYNSDMNNNSVPITIPLNKEKYFCLELQNAKYTVSCRHLDKSIKFYYNDKTKDILLQSFVSCIAKTADDKKLFTGHINGKIYCWDINYDNKDNISIELEEEFLAHDECVNCIVINEELNIIMSGSDVICFVLFILIIYNLFRTVLFSLEI